MHQSIMKAENLPDLGAITETHLLEQIYRELPEDARLKQIKKHTLDTPRGDLPRPTTETTAQYLAEWLQKPEHQNITSVLFITQQPHNHNQEMIIRNVLDVYHPSLKYEVVGNIDADATVETQVRSIGQTLFAGLPGALIANGVKEITGDQSETLMKLYQGNPVLKEKIATLKVVDDKDNLVSKSPQKGV
jgi:hypothetical protein